MKDNEEGDGDWEQMTSRMEVLRMRLASQEVRNSQVIQNGKLRNSASHGPSQISSSSNGSEGSTIPDNVFHPQNSRETYTRENNAAPASSKVLPPLGPRQYEILWEEGSLGLTFVHDEVSKLPVVKRVRKGDCSTATRVDAGDYLVYINEKPTCQLSSMDEVVSLFRDLPKPVLLRFEARKSIDEIKLPPLQKNEKEVLWEEGSLGLAFIANDKGIPTINRFLGKAASIDYSDVAINDELILVNYKKTEKLGFDAVMEYLRDTPKPLILRFRTTSQSLSSPQTIHYPVCESSQDTMITKTEHHPKQRGHKLEKNQYEIIWEEGPLGISLVEGSNGNPLVHRITGKGSAKDLNKVEIDDELVFVNRHPCKQFQLISLLDHLKTAKKPVHLIFCKNLKVKSSVDSLRESTTSSDSCSSIEIHSDQYQIIWDSGNLGLSFAESKTGGAEVNRFTGKETNIDLSNVSIGDKLVRINNHSCLNSDVTSIMENLKAMKKPAHLFFQKILVKELSSSSPKIESSSNDDSIIVSSDDAEHVESSICSDEHGTYFCVLWTEGGFGYTLKPKSSSFGIVPVISRKTGHATCKNLQELQKGNLLMQIGSHMTYQMGFDEATKLLKSIPKPVSLKFLSSVTKKEEIEECTF